MIKRPDPKLLLLRLFGYPKRGENLAAYPFELRLINWDQVSYEGLSKAMPAEFFGEFCWQILLHAGFVKERVLQIVDPALVPLISRLLDLPVLTLGSCSGHMSRKSHSPYIHLVFRDVSFGHQFLDTCRKVFLGRPPELTLTGHITEALWSYTGTKELRFFGVSLPVNVCVENYLSIQFSWETALSKELPLVWQLFSEVLDDFDHQGKYTPTRTALRQQFVMDTHTELFSGVLESLFAAVRR